MQRYQAYGLSIHSELPLPELVSGPAGPPDVTIRLGAVGHPRSDGREATDATATTAYYVTPTDVCFFWEQVGAFQVRDGREIVVEPVRGVEEQLVHLPLLGSVLGILLHQRGLLALHASAVAIGDRVAVFLGSKGEGKSTMAATLYGRGHAILADDVVAIDFGQASRPLVRPGFPQLKLFDDAAAWSLGDDPASLPRLASVIPNRARRAAERFERRALPLGLICALDDGPGPALTPLPPHEAVCELVGSSIAARFGSALLAGADAVTHFRRCARLLQETPVCRLSRPRNLSALASTAEMVERQLAQPVRAR